MAPTGRRTRLHCLWRRPAALLVLLACILALTGLGGKASASAVPSRGEAPASLVEPASRTTAAARSGSTGHAYDLGSGLIRNYDPSPQHVMRSAADAMDDRVDSAHRAGRVVARSTGDTGLRAPPLDWNHTYYVVPSAADGATTGRAVLVHNASACMTPDQKALKDLVDEVTLGGRQPLSRADAEVVLDWAGEVGYGGRRALPGDVADPSNWTANPVPHIHLPGAGRSGHVPVEPGVRPRPRDWR